MGVDIISLKNFRNFGTKTFNFSEKTTVIIGPNASGKTNILEAINLLSTGKSFRAKVEEEMVNYTKEIAHIRCIASNGGIDNKILKTKLEVVLTRGEITIGEDPENTQKVPKKKLMVNGIPRRLFNFSGNLKVVIFGPKDLDLVTESPSKRRNFLDSVLTVSDREYHRASMSYEKGLRQRNKLLVRIREEGLSRSQLLFWDRLLIKNGDYISKKRKELIDFINDTKDLNEQHFNVEYDNSAISEARLEQYAREEVASATTLVGPHRDDLQFSIINSQFSKKRKRDLARYGSRGEQRMGVLWLKLAELEYIKETSSGQSPTLLLDDIFSELDHDHRDIVMGVVGNQQTIITTADPHNIKGIRSVEKIEL